MIRLNLPSGDALPLKPSPIRKFRGLRIPGATLYQFERSSGTISLQVYKHRLFVMTLRHLHFKQPARIVTAEENPWIRMEIPLSGHLSILLKGGLFETLSTGSYHVSKEMVYASDIQPSNTLIYLTLHFSEELLKGNGSDEPFTERAATTTPKELLDLVQDILKCPFQASIRDFYYANKIRDILFVHSVASPVVMPGELRPEQVAQVYEADRIMAENLDGSITIPQLARMLGTNFVTLKRNYEKVFGMGLFARFMQRKMEHIQLLLENTDKPLKEIADLSGYQTLPGFINAFRKRHNMTPNDWRKLRRGAK